MANVIVLCEYSGTVRDAFIRAGHNAVSFDVLPSESTLGRHVVGDIRETALPFAGWADLVIAHPPCTYLSNSGVRWLSTQPGRWEKMRAGAEFFRWCYDFPAARVAVENPIVHRYALDNGVPGRQQQVVQPWQYGHGETKATCLWLRGLPCLVPTNVVSGREHRVHRMSPGPERQKERARFYPGFADAMATQWGMLDEMQQDGPF